MAVFIVTSSVCCDVPVYCWNLSCLLLEPLFVMMFIFTAGTSIVMFMFTAGGWVLCFAAPSSC